MTRASVLVVLAPLLAGCVNGDYNRTRVNHPPDASAVAALAPGSDTLDACLDALGAPVHVVELGAGAALAWGWYDETNWNVEVEVPLSDNAAGSFRYESTDAEVPGLVLFFDDGWRLLRIERGFLRDLLPARRTPRLVEG